MAGQHNVGRDQEPKRVIAYKRNIDKYGNDGEPGDDERNYVYTENVEHRRCPYAREICARFDCARAPGRTLQHPWIDRTRWSAPFQQGPSDSGVFAVSEWLARLLSQLTIITTAALPTDELYFCQTQGRRDSSQQAGFVVERW
jgi:hypothetical protein